MTQVRLIAVLAAASTVLGLCGPANAVLVFSERVGAQSPVQPTSPPGAISVPVGTIAGVPGSQIHITRIAIGGDSRVSSGDNRFRAVGGGVDFTFTAGQQAIAADFDLGFTPFISGQAHGFTYQVVDFTAIAGVQVDIFWDYHFDYDGMFTQATDIHGNVFDDSLFPSSIRPWVEYEYASVNTAVMPEPASAMLLLAACAGLLRRRRVTRH